MKAHYWSEDELGDLRRWYRKYDIKECTRMLNWQFSLDLSEQQVRSATRNHRIKSGRDGCFKPGQVSWNKGRSMPDAGLGTRFVKGQVPVNHREVGSERVDKDGYILVKTAEPRTWRHKHRLVWEAGHGEIPKGYVVLFLNQDKSDCRLDTLALLHRKRLGVVNRMGLLRENAELTRTGLAVAELKCKASDMKRRMKEQEEGRDDRDQAI